MLTPVFQVLVNKAKLEEKVRENYNQISILTARIAEVQKQIKELDESPAQRTGRQAHYKKGELVESLRKLRNCFSPPGAGPDGGDHLLGAVPAGLHEGGGAPEEVGRP